MSAAGCDLLIVGGREAGCEMQAIGTKYKKVEKSCVAWQNQIDDRLVAFLLCNHFRLIRLTKNPHSSMYILVHILVQYGSTTGTVRSRFYGTRRETSLLSTSSTYSTLLQSRASREYSTSRVVVESYYSLSS